MRTPITLWKPQFLKRKAKVSPLCEKGVMSMFSVAIMAVTIFMLALLMDLGGALYARHEAQLLADAGSIAGASAVDITGTYDSSGNVTGTVKTIDPTAASQFAQDVMDQNISQRQLSGQRNVVYMSDNKYTVGSDSYYVSATVEYKSTFLGLLNPSWQTIMLTRSATAQAK
jgi:uncharacterized membrane protein